jgi:hypothetical protein
MGAKMLKFPIPERQEINFEFTIKVFVGSKIWYLNKFYLFLFSKNLGCYKCIPWLFVLGQGGWRQEEPKQILYQDLDAASLSLSTAST